MPLTRPNTTTVPTRSARGSARAGAPSRCADGHLRRVAATSPTASSCRRSTTSRSRRACRPASRVVGVGREPHADDEFARNMREAVAEFSRRSRSTPRSGRISRSGMSLRRRLLRRPDTYARLRAQLEELDNDALARRATGSSTSPCRRPTSADHAGAARARPGSSTRRSSGAWTRVDHREALRPRPGERARAEPARAARLRREQVYRIDHYSARRRSRTSSSSASPTASSSRIWNRQLRRPRADHRGRGASASRRAATTTTGRASCATWCRTTCCSSLPHRDGAAGRFAADAVRDEKVKVLRAIEPFAAPEQVLARTSCAASTPRARAGDDVPGYREEPDVAKRLAHRDLRGDAVTSTTGAGAACRSTCAPASGCPSASPRSRSSSSQCRTRSSARQTADHAPNVLVDAHPARRGHRAALHGQGPGQRYRCAR